MINAKLYLFVYTKNNKIVIKLNNSTLVKMIKKQVLEKIIYKIDIYFKKNIITINKFYTTQILLSRNIIILIINKKKAKKLIKITIRQIY